MTGRNLRRKKASEGRKMESLSEIFARIYKVSLRWGLLLLSALFVSSATALVYDKMVYERPLNVGSAVTGSGSTAPPGVTFSPPTILILAVSVFIISLSVFGFLREARKHFRNTSVGHGSSATGQGSTPPGEAEWEESPRKEEESSTASSG